MDGLAGAIDAAVGIEVAVDRRGDRAARCPAGFVGAPADPLLGQVDRRAVEIQHGQVAVGAVGHHHLGVGRAFAVEERAVETHTALGVAAGLGQVLAVAGDQRHADAGHHLCGLERPDHDVERLGAVIGQQGHVGEHYPAPRLGWRIGVIAVVVAGLDRAAAGAVADLDHIGAWLHFLQHRAEREDGRGALTRALCGDREFALPDHATFVVRTVGTVVVGILALAGGIGRADRLADQIAVHDAPHLDLQTAHIDRLDPDAVGVLARQDHALAGEADIGRLLAEGEVDVGVGGQGLAALGGQALQQGDTAVGESGPRHAKLGALDRDGGAGAEVGRDQDEVGVGFRGVERPGQFNTGLRLGAAGVDAMTPDGEAFGLGNAATGGAGGARLSEQRPALGAGL